MAEDVTPWWQSRMAALDLETTAADPEEARIVQAALAYVGGGMDTHTATMLCDPGVEIPAEATAVHGITTEHARAYGEAPADIVRVLAEAVTDAGAARMPLVVFNAPYDLTVLDRECRRHGIAPLVVGPTVDPLVIDKHLDRYRGGSRQLEAMCVHHNVTIDGAHDATHDALAAARLAWRLASSGQVIRRVRNAQEGREKAALVRAWEDVRHDLPRLHEMQRAWYEAQAYGLAQHFREHPEKGYDPDAVSTEWPVRSQ